MTQRNDERAADSFSSAEELRRLLEKLVGDEEPQPDSAVADPEDASLEAQTPQLITEVEEIEQPTLSGGGDFQFTSLDRMDFPLILPVVDEEDEDLPHPIAADEAPEDPIAPVAGHRNPFVALWDACRTKLPAKGDSTPVMLRKLALLLAVVVFLCAVVFLLFDMAIQPAFNQARYDRVAAMWQPDNQNTLLDSQQEGYPRGMLEGFAALYDKNPDVRGWLTYRASSEKDFLSIDYPVMYSGDNDTYRWTDFYGSSNKNGALFFHKDAHLEADNHSNKCLVIYGNNMADGQMFAGLNKLVGNVNYARAAATMTLSTLFEQHEYKVIAVVITDEQAGGQQHFDPLRTTFPTNGDFMDYIDEVRARSLFDFPVEVIPGDQLAMLTTEASRSVAKLPDARITVIARKVRSGESAGVKLVDIVKNQDVIMPYAWYKSQGLVPHDYYETGELPELVITTTATTTIATTTTTSVAEDTTGTGTADEETTATNDGTAAAQTTDTVPASGTTDAIVPGTTDLTNTTTTASGAQETTTTGETSTAKTTGTTVGDNNNTVSMPF